MSEYMNAYTNVDGTPIINTIHNCDALTLLEALPDGCVDMVLTSPPYDNLRDYNGYSFNFEPIACASYRVIKPGGVMVWVVGDSTIDGCETLTSMRQALYFVDHVGFKMHDTMIYNRPGRFPESNRYKSDFEYMFIFSRDKPVTFNAIYTKSLNSPTKIASERQRNGDLKYPKNIRTTNEKKP